MNTCARSTTPLSLSLSQLHHFFLCTLYLIQHSYDANRILSLPIATRTIAMVCFAVAAVQLLLLVALNLDIVPFLSLSLNSIILSRYSFIILHYCRVHMCLSGSAGRLVNDHVYVCVCVCVHMYMSMRRGVHACVRMRVCVCMFDSAFLP